MRYKSLIITFVTMLLLSGFTLSYSQNSKDNARIKDLYDNAKNFNNTGKYSLAIDALKQAIILKEKTNTDIPPEYFKIYNRLGIAYRAQGNLQQAIHFYKEALNTTSDEYNLSVINGNIANVYSLKGNYLTAITYYENSLAVLQRSKKKNKYSKIAENYHNQGYAYNNLHNYQRAKEKFLRAIRIAKQNNIYDIADTYYNCGVAYKRLDSLELAEYYFTKAVDINLNEYGENHIKTTLSYLYLADFYAQIGKYTKAIPIFNKKVCNKGGNKHPYTADYYQSVGNMYFLKGKYKHALECYQQSIVSKILEFNDSSIYKNPSMDALPDIKLLEILKYKAQALVKLSEQENQKDNLKAALNTLELTVEFIEQLRKSYLYENSKLILAEKKHETYMSIISISFALMDITNDRTFANTAFRYSERSKYAILRESINENAARNIASIPDSISIEERRIKEQLGIIRKQIEDVSKNIYPDTLLLIELKDKHFQLTQKQETIIKSFERDYPSYYKQKYSNEVVSIPQLQQVINEKEAIIEYVLEDSSLYTFTITQDTFLLIKQSADSAFHSSLDFYKTVLHREHTSSYKAYRKAAYSLYKKLISPIEPLLEGKNLLIIPDGKMNFISFDALIDKPYSSSDKLDYRKELYLIRKYPIGYAYSATLYKNSLNKTYKNPKGFFGIAPGYENSKDSLRHISMGLKNVKRIALLTLGKSITGDRATERKLKKYCSKYDIVHFYAHGFEDTLNPENSKLVLYNDEDSVNDGYLYTWEVYNMQLNTQLVVLGSCYSGAGKLSKGEGVLSISRSFILAGCKSVIMSLWLAADKPSNDMLDYFYLNSFKGMRKDEALRLAKLKYLEKTNTILAHPRFWAGIVVNGNQDALYKMWYLKRVCVILGIVGLLIFIIRKRKSLSKFF